MILGIPFFTQIYPFNVSSTGLSINIMGKEIVFPFISPIKQKEIRILQTSSIYQTINAI